ncbi:MAG: Rpn family recombination-promoting nuclease/putative transposase [Bacteroidales bacterium]|nr:Rpn family recombination-promoting nuclease/putative transposase [Bacteroidales bacterium]
MSTNNNNKNQGHNTLRNDVKYLDPKADVTFKLVFGEHEDLVMSLLNALLPLDEDEQITHVEYLSPEMVPENPGKKYSLVDVRCTDQKKRQFIVEMQMYWNPYFQQRVILNASKAVVKQLNKGEDYRLIQPVYCLSLINDIGFESAPDEFYHDYAIVNTEHPEKRIEGLRFVFVELPKFTPKTFVEKKMAVLWLRFLTEIGEKHNGAPSELLDNELTSKALGIVEKSAMTDAQLYAYESFWMAVYDEQAISEGRYIKGRAEGEQAKAIETARKMKAKNYPVADIAEMTGLTIDIVNGL